MPTRSGAEYKVMSEDGTEAREKQSGRDALQRVMKQIQEESARKDELPRILVSQISSQAIVRDVRRVE